MNRKKIAIVFGFSIFLTITGVGQDVMKFNTKDLVEISKKFGFDSVFNAVGNWSIYDLDPTSAFEIAQTVNNQYSKYADNYLINYSLRNSQDTSLISILQSQLENELSKIQEYKPDYNWELPIINTNLIHLLLDVPFNNSEDLLIRYYNEWQKKSFEYKSDYLKGVLTNRLNVKRKLMSPYESCNFNCYLILLGLQKINSSFSDNRKLDSIKQYLPEDRQINLPEPDNLTNFSPTEKYKTITLINKYKSIGEIDLSAEPELVREFNEFSESYLLTDDSKLINKRCFMELLYCEKSGYLQLRCSLGGMAGKSILYRIELQNETLIFYYISSTAS